MLLAKIFLIDWKKIDWQKIRWQKNFTTGSKTLGSKNFTTVVKLVVKNKNLLYNFYYQVEKYTGGSINAYYFLREFCEHMNMNYSKPNKNLISVMTLLKSTPEIPTYEELEKRVVS